MVESYLDIEHAWLWRRSEICLLCDLCESVELYILKVISYCTDRQGSLAMGMRTSSCSSCVGPDLIVRVSLYRFVNFAETMFAVVMAILGDVVFV